MLAVVFLGSTCHAGVAVFPVILPVAVLLVPAAVLATAVRLSLASRCCLGSIPPDFVHREATALVALMALIVALFAAATTIGTLVTAATVGGVPALGALALPGSTLFGFLLLACLLLLFLLLQDLLLLGDLVEQAREGRHALRSRVPDAVLLCLFLGLALLFGALLLGLLAGSLGLAAALLLDSALLRTALLGSHTLALCLLGSLALLFLLCLFLGLLLGLDLGGTGLEDRLELLADKVHVDVLKRRGRRLCRYLHLIEIVEHLLARHPIFLCQIMYAGLCHVTNLPRCDGYDATFRRIVRSANRDRQ